MKNKIKSKDLRKGMIIGWVEDGIYECEGVMVDNEIINGRSITFNNPELRLGMSNKSILYFEKSKLELK